MNRDSLILLVGLLIVLLLFNAAFVSPQIYAAGDMGGGDMGGGDMGGGDMDGGGGGNGGDGGGSEDNIDIDSSNGGGNGGDGGGSEDNNDSGGSDDNADGGTNNPPTPTNIQPSDNVPSLFGSVCRTDYAPTSNKPSIVSIQYTQVPPPCLSGPQQQPQQQGTVSGSPQVDWWASTGVSVGSTAGAVLGSPGGPLTMTGGALAGGAITGLVSGGMAKLGYAEPTKGSTVFNTPQGDWWASAGATLGAATGAALLSGASSVMWPVAGALAGAMMLGGAFGDLADWYYSPPIPPTGPATEVRQQQPPVSVFGAPPDSSQGSGKFRLR